MPRHPPRQPPREDDPKATAQSRIEPRRRLRVRARASVVEPGTAVMTDGVTIYQSDPDQAIERLAQLDSARCPSGRVLVAAVGGEPRAALPLEGGRAIADPFHRTAELMSLLELRVAQTNGRSSRGRLARLAEALRRGRRASGGLAPAARALP